MKRLARDLVTKMPQLTSQRASETAFANAHLNQPHIEKTILDLPDESPTGMDQALVISAGPSLHRMDSIGQILRAGWEGTIVCADGALGHCLRQGLIPDYVVTVDPHHTRIVRWFGDPDLASHPEDDYYRRQDLDPYLAEDELNRNTETIKLVDKYGPRIKAIISTSASQRVTRRCSAAGMDLYWWNPLFDDFNSPGSLTAQIYALNKVPCMVSGGNVGSAAWIFAHAVLHKTEIAMVGMDFSYAPGTPFDKTQYYKEIEELFGNQARDAYIKVHNPHLKETWFTDPAYYWYRQTFLQMAREANCTTFNCTEGGILFGKGVRFASLREFLQVPFPSREKLNATE